HPFPTQGKPFLVGRSRRVSHHLQYTIVAPMAQVTQRAGAGRIAGAGETTMAIATINPATGERLRSFEPLRAEEIEAKLQRAPAWLAGNVGLLKHASNVPQCALAIEAIFRRAGFPEGVFQTLLIGSEPVARVLDDSRVAAATLTGSEPAGSRVAGQAGKQIKK